MNTFLEFELIILILSVAVCLGMFAVVANIHGQTNCQETVIHDTLYYMEPSRTWGAK